MTSINGAKVHCSKLPRLNPIRPMHGVYMKCMVMCGSGVRTGREITRLSRLLTRQGRIPAAGGCCAVARGSSTAGTAVPPTGTASRRTSVTATSVSALPEVMSTVSPAQVRPEQASSRLGAARRQRAGARRGAGCGRVGRYFCKEASIKIFDQKQNLNYYYFNLVIH